MACAAYGDQEVVRAGEVHRADHVGDAGAADDEVGAPVDHRVVDLAGGIVTVVIRADERATQTGLGLRDRVVPATARPQASLLIRVFSSP
jgi:hypothetical protein